MAEKVTVRTTGEFMFSDIRTGEHVFPGRDNVVTNSPLVEAALDDGRLKRVRVKEPAPEPDKVPEPPKTK